MWRAAPSDRTRGSTRFAQIDAISRAAALREREKTVQLLSEYTKKEYLTAALFGAEEENDVIYQTT